MANPEHLQFLQFQTPTIWFLLNSKAQSTLPPGIVEYIGTGDRAEIEEGKAGLVTAERHLNTLISLCGKTDVLATYRRDLSKISTFPRIKWLPDELPIVSAAHSAIPYC